MFQGRLLNIVNVQRDKHQDTYSCEAENSESNGYPLVYHINLIVEGKASSVRSSVPLI